MIDDGDTAPDFALPVTRGTDPTELEELRLSEALGDGPVVLAFYPAAFTRGCREEMCAFRDSMAAFDEIDGQVYGVSVDLPFSQQAWIEEESLTVPMLSDWDHEVIHAYGVVRDDVAGMLETAQRSIFIVDTDGIVRYRWVQGDTLPDFEAVVTEVAEELAALSG